MEQQKRTVEEFEVEVDLREIFFALFQKWYLIALIGILTAGIFFGVNKYGIQEKFKSETSIYILNQDTEELTYSDLQLGTGLTKDYEVLIESRTVLEEVIKKLKLEMTYEVLAGAISVSVPDSTRIVEIAVTTTDPALSQMIANEVREVASKTISEVMNVDAVNVVEKANLPTTKCAPSVARNTVLGGMLGALATCAVIMLFILFNDTIRTQEDVEKYLEVSTLGIIPLNSKAEAEEKKQRKKRRGKKT